MRLFINQLKRELLIYSRQPRGLLNTSLFFFMIVIFFPLTIPPVKEIVRQVAPGLIWTAMLLSLLLASERIFQQDYEDGIIEQWLISGFSLNLIIVAKLCVHWLFSIIPMLIFCPLLAFLFNFSFQEAALLAASLILGTPAILALCVLAAAFSTRLQQKGIFMALILLPLVIPVMIFGSGACLAALEGSSASAYLAILAALSLVAVSFLPFAISTVIRISLSD
ncbi:heme exporter protein CcmB [Legionella quinlivanii]|uniref:Heme exporter protein B n=1 Tax=Legionella quinlivanii TaxID=45073 RepID=A0A0W0Y432_9GAMM|nr:heme exporter protein CcmB [Legionella quinlivanii]KTD51772.1 heme exporter protein CcmB [Legionella quinlivanii]MCW8451109.1 heme exporter protein CcmB [Legionella quinlivanii]SEF65887.1 heme exporter protein B [Legionella quinlivanii DSM 21216]STY10700.1 heme exporter protein CcmB [Legionella quinlivanii]